MSPSRRRPPSPSTLLRRLEAVHREFGSPGAAGAKLDLLAPLAARRLATAGEVRRLHEVLCYLHAYPDDRAVLDRVEEMLAAFAERSDLRRRAKQLADSGIAGTRIHYSFYWFTALWLARRWPEQLRIEWSRFGEASRLERMTSILLPYAETPALDEIAYSSREWVERFKGPGETDAEFLVRRFEALAGNGFVKENVYESLDIPMVIEPGADTPSRTHAKVPRGRIHYQTRPIDASRPDLRRDILLPPRSVRPLSEREARPLIDLAREAMVTRSRDLDNFVHADPRDARLVDCGDGLQFAVFGLVPERRLLLESVYGALTLKNGVPIGYVLASALFGSSEVAYNVFETYRGGEAARVYGRVLAMVHALFGSDTISVDPYQLGHDNEEGLRSGAWWFYYKLGFRPHDRDVRALVRRERARMKRNPKHRSSRATLQNLSAEYMYFHLDRPRSDVLGRVSLGNIGLHVSAWLSRHYGGERERGIREASETAAFLLRVRSLRSFSPAERQAWERWAPLVMVLGVNRWSAGNRRKLARIIRAKGGRRESDYVRLALRHPLLRRALLRLAAGPPEEHA